MGVDVNSVAGFTVVFPEGVLSRLINEAGCEDAAELFDKARLPYSNYGSHYSGNVLTALIFEPYSPKEIDKQVGTWLTLVNDGLGTSLTLDDVEFINELLWY